MNRIYSNMAYGYDLQGHMYMLHVQLSTSLCRLEIIGNYIWDISEIIWRLKGYDNQDIIDVHYLSNMKGKKYNMSRFRQC